jgi:hypothetical protein
MGQYIKIKTKNDMPPVLNATKLFCRFKMDGCGYCVDSQEAWDDVCKKVEGVLNPECVIGEIESKLLPFFKMRDGFKPDGFPTHAVFKDGKHVENINDRSATGLMHTLKKHKFIGNTNKVKSRKNRRSLSPRARRQPSRKRRQTK